MSMSLFEYDEKLHEKTLLEIGREEGLQQGIQGTVTALKSMGCTSEEIIKKIIEVYKIDFEKAKSLLK